MDSKEVMALSDEQYTEDILTYPSWYTRVHCTVFGLD